MESAFAWAMAGVASAHQAATATREDTSQPRAGRTRRTSADPQRAQQGATAATTAAPAAGDSLSRLQQLADASPRVAQLRRLQALADDHYAPVSQLAGAPEEEELIQGQFAGAELQPQLQQAPRTNNTGLPDQLKSGIESLSGLSMDDVRVHRNSSQPAQLNALAYAQGNDIHLSPGQEQHLPHEAWHVVQQRQGRVQDTMQMAGVGVNDDEGLEREADVMGGRATNDIGLQNETNTSLQSVRQKTIQLRHVVPRIRGNALEYSGMKKINDDQAPTKIAEYNYEHQRPLASRDAALAEATVLYENVGNDLKANPAFISRGTLRTFATGNAVNAPVIYDILKHRLRVPAVVPGVGANENQKMLKHYSPLLQGNELTRERLNWFQDNEDVNLTDPLFIKLNIPWQSPQMQALASLNITVSFTEAFRAYVYRIEDSAANVNATMERRDPYVEANNGVNRINTFSATHHADGEDTAAAEIALSCQGTQFQQERGIDAMSRVIAEGGRFLCVRALGTNIRNVSKFYTTNPEDNNEFIYIEFWNLWRLWMQDFRGDYGISNARVRQYISNEWLAHGQGVVNSMSQDVVGDGDYDLRQ